MTIRIAVLALGIMALAGGCAVSGASGDRANAQSYEQIRDELWAKEQAIYAGRSRGDLTAYLSNLSTGYMAWPPFDEVPKGTDGLQATSRRLAGTGSEKLEMTYLDLAVNGDTAIIYYKTHRTMLPDGSPVDQHYEVTHTWVREQGEWKVMGGMARMRPDRE